MGSRVTGPYDLFQGSSSSIRAGHHSHVNARMPLEPLELEVVMVMVPACVLPHHQSGDSLM
jgi:hypothetical protein